MNWPSPKDFNDAIRNPSVAFVDPDLAAGDVVLAQDGRPIPRPGESADVYQVCSTDGRSWAVKCFTRPPSGLAGRYAQVEEAFDRAGLPSIVGFEFLPNGIRVGAEWYPVLKMEWVEGRHLNQVVRDMADNPTGLDDLLRRWARLCRQLRSAGLAHADLHHQNVLLVPGVRPGTHTPKLIDYDGVYIPALASDPPSERGHPNYQHPARATARVISADLDRFPHLVIATALKGLSVIGPGLWDRYDTGNNLLFTAADFRAPAESALLRELWESDHPELRTLAGNLALACSRPIPQTPWLDELLADGRKVTLSAAKTREAARALGLEGPAVVLDTPEAAAVPAGPAESVSRSPARSKRAPLPKRAKRSTLVAAALVVGLLMIVGTVLGVLAAYRTKSDEIAQAQPVEPPPSPTPGSVTSPVGTGKPPAPARPPVAATPPGPQVVAPQPAQRELPPVLPGAQALQPLVPDPPKVQAPPPPVPGPPKPLPDGPMAVAPVLPPIAKPKPVPAPPPPDALLANPDAAMKPRWVARVGVDAALATVGYDAEGQQLIVGNRTNHTIAVIDAQTGMQKPDRVAGLRWTGKEDLLFLLGGRLGLYSRTDPTVAVWNLKRGKADEPIPVPDIPPGRDRQNQQSVWLSSDEKYMAVARSAIPKAPAPLQVFEVATGKALIATEWPGGVVHFTTDPARVLIIEAGGRFRWFKLPTGEPDGEWQLPKPEGGAPAQLSCSVANAPRVGYAGPPVGKGRVTLAVFDGNSGAIVHAFGPEYAPASGVMLSADGSLAAVARKPHPADGNNTIIDVVEVGPGRVVGRASVPSGLGAPTFFLTPDGRALVVHSSNGGNLHWFDLPARAGEAAPREKPPKRVPVPVPVPIPAPDRPKAGARPDQFEAMAR